MREVVAVSRRAGDGEEVLRMREVDARIGGIDRVGCRRSDVDGELARLRGRIAWIAGRRVGDGGRVRPRRHFRAVGIPLGARANARSERRVAVAATVADHVLAIVIRDLAAGGNGHGAQNARVALVLVRVLIHGDVVLRVVGKGDGAEDRGLVAGGPLQDVSAASARIGREVDVVVGCGVGELAVRTGQEDLVEPVRGKAGVDVMVRVVLEGDVLNPAHVVLDLPAGGHGQVAAAVSRSGQVVDRQTRIGC